MISHRGHRVYLHAEDYAGDGRQQENQREKDPDAMELFHKLAFTALFLLFAEHSLLLTLHLLEASHEARFLLGLGGCFFHTAAHVVLLDEEAECVCLYDSDEERQEVIIRQAGCVIIEENHKEDGHQIHHPLHAGHCVGLILGVEVSVDDICSRHQEAEEGDMVTEIFGDEWDVSAPGHDGIRSGEVVSPEETLSAEFYARWEE